jgi:hypothetical protein
MTFAQYATEIGMRMADRPRESAHTDTALAVYGKDFVQAQPKAIKSLLYYPKWSGKTRKGIVYVGEKYHGLDPEQYPGIVPYSNGVAVTEDYYDAVSFSPVHLFNRVANRTSRSRIETALEAGEIPNEEEIEPISIESGLYPIFDRIELLEGADQQMLTYRDVLTRLRYHLQNPSDKRVQSLEVFRRRAELFIHAMVEAACRQERGTGTNFMANTQNAVTSNLYRAKNPTKEWLGYLGLAIDYNDAVRGKINASIHACGEVVAKNTWALIRNVDREYE